MEVIRVLALLVFNNDHFLSNKSVFNCSLAVIFSTINTFFTLSLHCVMLGGCGFNQEAVIVFFAISSRILSKYLELLSVILPELCPKCSASSIGKLIPIICSISFWIFSQKSFIFGQSQNIWVVSPTAPHSLQHRSVVLLYFAVINGVLK